MAIFTHQQNDQRKALLDSGLFTQVETDVRAERLGMRTFVNKSRGVIATQNSGSKYTHISFDKGGERYYVGGHYDQKDIEQWILPLMKSDGAWRYYCANPDSDAIEALDNAGY